jgi:serine O-acetyltransferase
VLETVRTDLVRWRNPGVRHQDLTWSLPAACRALVTELGAWAVLEYRFRRWIRTAPPPALRPLLLPVAVLTKKLVEIAAGISISTEAVFGPGLYIGHFSGIVVGGGVRVGENCNLGHGVTLGDHDGSPVVGDCVYFAAGAKVFGPITIGDAVAVGANAVVSESVPSNSTVVAGRPQVLEDRGNVMAPG